MRLAAGFAVGAMYVAAGAIWAQDKPVPPWPPAQLDIAAEVATTTVEGYPSSLRVTLTNIGSDAVTLPVPGGCSPENGLSLQVGWIAKDGRYGAGRGGGCGSFGNVLMSAQNHWILLRPGEYITQTLNLREQYEFYGPGTVTYHVIYAPPSATEKDWNELAKRGLIIPTEQIETDEEQFAFRGSKAPPQTHF